MAEISMLAVAAAIIVSFGYVVVTAK